MADSDPSLDPEPVDAEFEPADVDLDKPVPSNGPGYPLVIGLALMSLLGGGLLGAIGASYLQPSTQRDETAETRQVELTSTLTHLETRLAALEAEDLVADAQAAVSGDLSTLDERVDALEAVPPGRVDLSVVEARLAALETAPTGVASDNADLMTRLDTLETAQTRSEALANQALDAIEAMPVSPVDPAVLDSLIQRVAALEAVANTPASTPVETMPDRGADIAALIARVEALEGQQSETRQIADSAQSTANHAAELAQSQPGMTADADAARQLGARALALTALRDQAEGGGSFEAERAALARLWRGNAELAALAAHARAGTSTLDELAQSYPGEAIRDAGAAPTRLWGMIDIRRVDPDADATDVLALTALAEERLAVEDLEAAVTITERLEGEALDVARDWLVHARARLDVDTRIEALRAQLTQDAAEQGADPS